MGTVFVRQALCWVLSFVPCSGVARAQWTSMPMNPPGVIDAAISAVSVDEQGGQAKFSGLPADVPAIWHGSPGSALSLGQGSVGEYGGVFGIWQGTEAGWLSGHASLWQGSAASRLDLNPPGTTSSVALAIRGSQQAGYAIIGGFTRAGWWNSTASSWVDLSPAGASSSIAYAADGSHQGGYFQMASAGSTDHAALWSGTAASLIDLNPLGSTASEVSGMAPGQQVGYALRTGSPALHASIWSGSAASWVDVTPFAGLDSQLFATTGSIQVGSTNVPTAPLEHAGVWFGAASSFVDLHAFLPSGYSSSRALAVVQAPDGRIIVGGWANTSAGVHEAMLWVYVPSPGSASLLFISCAACLRRSRAGRA
jgi:hypothetical protein